MVGKPLIAIIGPTASGKTRLAIHIAQALNGEIVGADSRQIYRYMDIGTAKPTSDERASAPHHLIDVVNPDETLSLAQYQRMTYATIDAVHTRGRIPLLVGGTGQYISAVLEGWSIPEIPPNMALRAELETFASEHGSKALHARLARRDPEAANNIEHQNVRRVVRALEVCIESGQPITELQRKQPPPYRIRTIGLTMERDRLYDRAARRIDQMMEDGFLDEVKRLLDMGYHRQLPAMSGLGYTQLADYLAGQMTLATAIEATNTTTHSFIRRQYTWFRKYNQQTTWYDAETDHRDVALADVAQWLQQQDT